jgi:lipopolysaccharide transport system ATP-binding protein
MSSDTAIVVKDLSKCYQIYGQPRDRLKQFVVPRLQKLIGQSPRTYYREFWALRDVSFEVKKGETVGIIGKNGSGKSTLLQLICGTLSPTAGTVETQGRIAALLELGSGFNPEFTGRENIFLNGAVLGLARQEIEARCDSIIAFADIGDFIDQPVKTYSTGMYVRLAFAIQANVDPDILIVDEALAVGDAYFVHRCMDRLHTLQANGATVLLVTHDGSFVKRFCERAIWVDHGRVVMSGPSSRVVDDYLNCLFQQPLAPVAAEGPAAPQALANAIQVPLKSADHAEQRIPNVDRRLGDQRCSIIGVALYSSDRKPVDLVNSGSEVLLRYTVENRNMADSDKLVFGYIFRNFRGEEIAATNTRLENVQTPSFLSAGDRITVEASIRLPILHQGAYSFSVGVSYLEPGSTDVKAADRLINAIVFNIATEKRITTITCFDTTFSLIRSES